MITQEGLPVPMMDASRSRPSTELPTSRGRISITDGVVQTIAGMAARRVSGIYSVGGGAPRCGALRERTSNPGGHDPGQGVSVEIGGRWAAVNVDLVVEYGVAIMPLVEAVRRGVVEWVHTMTGLAVIEVNVLVTDLHLPGDEAVQTR